MPIDVVYKLGSGEANSDYVELRYSLRSLSNFLDLGNVFIVGAKPNWIQNIVYLPAHDPYLRCKDANLINKLLLACYHKDLSIEFINISDDQFFLKETKYDDIKTPSINSKISHLKPPLNRWQTRMFHTLEKLKSRGYRGDCYETHIPCLLDKTKFPSTVLQYDYGQEPGLCGNSLYYNTLRIQGKEVDRNEILILEQPITDINILRGVGKGKRFFNYDQKAYNPTVLQYLKERFPIQSKYEVY